jgi:hypothetical protein
MKTPIVTTLAIAAVAACGWRAEAGESRYLGSASYSHGGSRTVGTTVGVPLFYYTSPQYSSCIYGSPGNPHCYVGAKPKTPHWVYQSNPWYTDKVYVRYQVASGSSSLKQVQSALAQRGYYRGAIDGLMGPQSQTAILQYQEAQSLRPTGVVDEPLLQALDLR